MHVSVRVHLGKQKPLSAFQCRESGYTGEGMLRGQMEWNREATETGNGKRLLPPLEWSNNRRRWCFGAREPRLFRWGWKDEVGDTWQELEP